MHLDDLRLVLFVFAYLLKKSPSSTPALLRIFAPCAVPPSCFGRYADMASVAMQQAARPTCRPRRALLCSVCRIRAAVRTAMGVVSWCMPPANLLQPSSGPGLALSETKSVPNPDTPLTTKQCWARALWQVGCCSRAVIRGFACSLRFSRAQLASGPAAAKRVFSEFIPSPQIDEITEPAAIDMFASYRFTDVTVAGYDSDSSPIACWRTSSIQRPASPATL